MRKQQQARDRTIGVKCTAEEYERIRAAAFKARLPLGPYLRELALKAESRTKK